MGCDLDRTSAMEIAESLSADDSDCASSASSGDFAETYFDRLPPEVLRNIVRQLSSRPKGEAWQTYIDAWELRDVLRFGGPLGDIIRQDFRHFHTWRVGDGVFGDGDATMDTLDIAGPIATEIGCRAEQLPSNMYHSHLPSLRSLLLFEVGREFNLARVLDECRGLEKLVLQGEVLSSGNIYAISVFATRTRELTLDFEWYEAVLSEIWIALGATLEKVCLKTAPIFMPFQGEMSRAERMRDSYLHIPAYCCNLRSFELKFSKGYGFPPDIIQCIGAKLDELKLMDCKTFYPPSDFQRILDACPNVKVDVHLQRNVSEALRVLGGNLRALRVEPCEYPDLGRSEDACSNIEELDLDIWQVDPHSFISEFFAAPKPCLRVLNVDALGKIPLKTCMDALARHAGTVRVFTCTTARLRCDDFTKFAASCRQLEKVVVEVYVKQVVGMFGRVRPAKEKADSSEDAVVSFVNDFAQCSNLKELVLAVLGMSKNSKRIADACVVFRERPIDVSICGQHYFP